MKKVYLYLTELILIFIVPIALLYFGLIPKELRLVVLGFYVIMVIGLTIRSHTSLYKLGVRVDTLGRYTIPYILFTLVGVCFVLVLAKILNMSVLENWQDDFHFIFLFLPVSIAQEVLYRGFLLSETRKVVHSSLLVIVVNVLLFSFMHIIFPKAFIMLPLAFVAGLSFVLMYQKYPNLILISLSHAVLNFVATLFSFFKL